MAFGESSSRPPSDSRSIDFGCDDFVSPDSSKGMRSDAPSKINCLEDYPESRMGKTLVSLCEPDEYSKEEVMSTVEKCMKKYADNLLRYLDGISGRLSQLEIYCYKLERSIGEFRADILRDQTDTDVKFKNLEKHLQEVHKSVQILRDKQELAETQKELAKLQVAHKESAENNKDGFTKTVSEPEKVDDKSDLGNHQCALVLPHQLVAPPQVSARASDPIPPYKEQPVQQQAPAGPSIQDRYIASQAATFYAQRQSFPQDQQNRSISPEMQYLQPRPQLQEVPVQAPLQQPQSVSQNQPTAFAQCQQQWPQQPPQQVLQQVVQPQQSPSQAQIRPQAPYTPYPLQPVNPALVTYPNSMPMQGPYQSSLQPSINRSEAVPFGYSGTGGPVPQSSPQHNLQRQLQPLANQSTLGPQPSKGGYMSTAPYPPQYNVQGYSSAYYQPSNLPAVQNHQLTPSSNASVHGVQLMRNHPYGDMIEKAIGMGYPRDQVASVVQKMLDSPQPMDFHALLDRLNGQAPGVSSRAW